MDRPGVAQGRPEAAVVAGPPSHSPRLAQMTWGVRLLAAGSEPQLEPQVEAQGCAGPGRRPGLQPGLQAGVQWPRPLRLSEACGLSLRLRPLAWDTRSLGLLSRLLVSMLECRTFPQFPAFHITWMPGLINEPSVGTNVWTILHVFSDSNIALKSPSTRPMIFPANSKPR